MSTVSNRTIPDKGKRSNRKAIIKNKDIGLQEKLNKANQLLAKVSNWDILGR